MNYAEASAQLRAHQQEINEIRNKIKALRENREPQAVEDYVLSTPEGAVRLSELFGDKKTLFVVHNMGRSCVYCTLWADGLNGMVDHLQDAAAFVVSSPDEPNVQAAFKADRGWRFPMVSHAGTTFADDMGYVRDGGPFPGVSVFQKDDSGVVRVADTEFGPGDDFCAIWHLLDLVPRNAEWTPKYNYV